MSALPCSFQCWPTYWLRRKIHASHVHSRGEAGDEYMRPLKLMRWGCGPTPALCSDKQRTLIMPPSQTDFHNGQAQHVLRAWPSMSHFFHLLIFIRPNAVWISFFVVRVFCAFYIHFFPIAMTMMKYFSSCLPLHFVPSLSLPSGLFLMQARSVGGQTPADWPKEARWPRRCSVNYRGSGSDPSCSRRNEQSITEDDNTFSSEDKPFSLASETFHVPMVWWQC